MISLVKLIPQVTKPILAIVPETEVSTLLRDALPCFGFDFAMLAIGMVLSICLLSDRRFTEQVKIKGKLAPEGPPQASQVHRRHVDAVEGTTSKTAACEQSGDSLFIKHVADEDWSSAFSLASQLPTEKLVGSTIDAQGIDALLAKCVEAGDVETAVKVENLARAQCRPLTDSNYSFLLKAFIGSQLHARSLVQEILSRDTPCFCRVLLTSILRFCKRHEKELADKVFDRIDVGDADLLSIVISFYLDSHQPEKACDIFEMNYATFFDQDIDADLEWRLMTAALQCGHQSLAAQLFETSPYGYPDHVSKIQAWWKRTLGQGCESIRMRRMHDMLARLSNAFVEQHSFDEDSDDESTVYLGDPEDSPAHSSSSDSEYERFSGDENEDYL